MDSRNEKEIVEIERICGHVDEVPIRRYKLERNRQRRIATLESYLCFRCFFEKTRAKYGLVPIRMDYIEYKMLYRRCLVDYHSYNSDSRRVTVYVRKEHRQRKNMIAYLVEECGLTYEQAEFLVDLNSWMRESFGTWFNIVDPGQKIKRAMKLIEENDPSYRYRRRSAEEERMFNLAMPPGIRAGRGQDGAPF
jgi:hypothetical protein